MTILTPLSPIRRRPRQIIRRVWIRLTSFTSPRAESTGSSDLAYEFFKDCKSDTSSPLKATSSSRTGATSSASTDDNVAVHSRILRIDVDSDASSGSGTTDTGPPSLAQSQSGSSNCTPSPPYQSFSNIYTLIDEMIQEQDRVIEETGLYPVDDGASLLGSVFTSATPICIFDDGSTIGSIRESVRASDVRSLVNAPGESDPFAQAKSQRVDDEVWELYLKELHAKSDSMRSCEENYQGKRVPLPLISGDEVSAFLAADDDHIVDTSSTFHELSGNVTPPRTKGYSTAEC